MLPGLTAQQALEKLTWEGAERRYPEGVPDKVIALLKHELRLIETLQYAPYFLTVNAIVQFARNSRIYQNILIVDRLFGAAELRLGSGTQQQTVRIARTDGRPAT